MAVSDHPTYERRGMGAYDSGVRRRASDLADLAERVADIENMRPLLDGLLEKVGSLDGRTAVMLGLLQNYLPSIEKKSGKVGFWGGVQIVGTLLVPILIAMISGYFLLKSSIPAAPTK